MRLYLDIETRRILSTPTRALSSLEFKRRDNDLLELVFLRESIRQELPAGTTARVGLKALNDYAGEFLAVTTLTQSGSGSSAVYTGELNLNTTALATAFLSEPVTLAAMLEVEWLSGTALSSSKTLPVTLLNDVIRGDEGDPAELPIFYTAETSDFLATQAQAEAGADNSTWMSPLRTAQAIAALAGSGGVSSYNDLTDVPAEFAPSAHTHTQADVTGLETALASKAATTHTHTLSDVTGLETALASKAATTHTHTLSDLTASGATTGQVATFDGSAWVPQDATGGGVTSYNDLTDVPSTFPPATHTHAIADVTGLQTALDGKQASGSYLTATGGITTIAVVSSMPASPDANTLYVVTA